MSRRTSAAESLRRAERRSRGVIGAPSALLAPAVHSAVVPGSDDAPPAVVAPGPARLPVPRSRMLPPGRVVNPPTPPSDEAGWTVLHEAPSATLGPTSAAAVSRRRGKSESRNSA